MEYIALLKNYLLIPVLLFQPYVWVLLRVVVGTIFFAHGFPKMKDMKGTAKIFDSMGFHPGNMWGTCIALLEVVGGFALVFGFFSQPFALLFAIEMLVATLTVKRRMGLVNGYEFDLILLVACLAIITQGSGILSIDEIIFGF
ncbi:MAG: DoxX family protein [Parcubacteria group bacterium]|nr:DoxX family protein [Parcubacteria group bacterium]